MAQGEDALFKMRLTELDNDTCILTYCCAHLIADGASTFSTLRRLHWSSTLGNGQLAASETLHTFPCEALQLVMQA